MLLTFVGYRARHGSDSCERCPRVSDLRRMNTFYSHKSTRYYFSEFNLKDPWLQGLVNGAPYLCSCLIGCWTTAPLNRWFGRRGCIFISCFVSFASSFWMACAHTWWNLMLGRFLLGFAVGAKSTTTPVYGAECAPANIRGILPLAFFFSFTAY